MFLLPATGHGPSSSIRSHLPSLTHHPHASSPSHFISTSPIYHPIPSQQCDSHPFGILSNVGANTVPSHVMAGLTNFTFFHLWPAACVDGGMGSGAVLPWENQKIDGWRDTPKGGTPFPSTREEMPPKSETKTRKKRLPLGCRAKENMILLCQDQLAQAFNVSAKLDWAKFYTVSS